MFQEKKDAEKPAEAKKPAEVKPKKPVVHVKEFEEDMVYVFQFTRSPQVRENIFQKKMKCYLKYLSLQIPSISPFCLKLESWLKLHGIKYQVGYTFVYLFCSQVIS